MASSSSSSSLPGTPRKKASFKKVARQLILQRSASAAFRDGLEGLSEEEAQRLLKERQTLASQNQNCIWGLVASGSRERILERVMADPRVLQQRDPVFVTPLLMLVLYKRTAIAREIMDMAPFRERIADQYGAGPYEGENCLHIACVNRDFPLAEYLVERCPALLTQRAVGPFFAPGSACYYGELPLSFAVSTNQSDMVRMMLAAGADVEAVDNFKGNSAMHLAVIHDCIDQYRVLQAHCRQADQRNAPTDNNNNNNNNNNNETLKQQQQQPDLARCVARRPNNEGLSCIELCAAVGSVEAFEFLIEDTRHVQWSYGCVSRSFATCYHECFVRQWCFCGLIQSDIAIRLLFLFFCSLVIFSVSAICRPVTCSLYPLSELEEQVAVDHQDDMRTKEEEGGKDGLGGRVRQRGAIAVMMEHHRLELLANVSATKTQSLQLVFHGHFGSD